MLTKGLKAAFLALLATFQPAALTSLRSMLLTLDTYSHMLHSMGGEAANAIGEALGQLRVRPRQ